MELIADILLGAGAIGAGIYCFVLGRRLNRFNDLEKGVGGAVAVLSAQVDDLTRTLTAAQQTAAQSAQTLTDLTARAEDMSRRLELQIASLHDLPPETNRTEPVSVPTAAPKRPAPTAPSREGSPLFARRATGTGDAA
ncbi:hypothetical protein KDD17_15620 [Sulfitobacter albidus]|uniref:Uncharacterized protein n=1 Tax=Sulfitobacter albidus TaxID=2829501 RepID=A0A975JDZ4_9RHOB|nr:hypothetical protein [Sulfitobacter albidus]QUJ76305.1 hypothetical protein KDD17_15620 [Sulfitobacter albidus]